MIEKIYIINLPKSTERRAWIEKQMADGSLSVEYQIVDGYDTPDLETAKKYAKQIGVNLGNLRMLPRKMGCYLAHYRCYQLAKIQGYKCVMILEDDAQFCEDFFERWSKTLAELRTKHWDAFLLWHVNCAGNKVTQSTPNLSKATKVVGGTCYILKERAIDLMLTNLRTMTTARDAQAMQLVLPKVTFYIATPHLVTPNMDFPSDIHDNLQ